MDAARRVSLSEILDLVNRLAVEVTRDALLERARRDGKTQRLLRRASGDEPVNQTGCEAVPSADSIHEPHVVALAAVERLSVPQHGAPAVVARGQALPQRDGDDSRSHLPHDPIGRLTVAVEIQ